MINIENKYFTHYRDCNKINLSGWIIMFKIKRWLIIGGNKDE